jgi:hypothetical protein
MKWMPVGVMVASLLVTPLSLRLLNHLTTSSAENRSYLPSIDNRRSRKSFRSKTIDELRYGNPEWVFIGDSMLGTRVDARLLGEISGNGDRNAMLLLQPASGPAYWYLQFKNHVVASGVKPRMTFFFFRDTNLTDTMFRLRSQLGDALDEVAHDAEPELDAIVKARARGHWSVLDDLLNRAYQVDVASAWMHPTMRRWYALRKYPDPTARLVFENTIEEDFNQNFRRDIAADIGDAVDAEDFYRDLPTSVLPLIVDLAHTHDVPVCFVRVQRRPVGNAPPEQSATLVKYVQEFKQWAQTHGAHFYDEHGDPELTLDLYEDGDHFADRAAYTRIFRRRLKPLLQ